MHGRVVQRGEGWRILEVRPTDPACHLLKLSEVKAVMDADMSFTGPPSTSDLLPLSPPLQPASTSGKPQAQSQHHKAKPVLQGEHVVLFYPSSLPQHVSLSPALLLLVC